jgi:hypothetical protein
MEPGGSVREAVQLRFRAAPAGTAAVGSAPESDSGIGAALFTTGQQADGGVGLAVLTAVATTG